jgi:hypothetical protein
MVKSVASISLAPHRPTMSSVTVEPSSESASANPGTRPLHPTFTKLEVKFLSGYLPECIALPTKKGTRSDWSDETPFPAFVKEFNCDREDGPNLEDLKKVSTCFNLWKFRFTCP